MSGTGRCAHHIAVALGKARREGRGWRCRCPLHGGCSLVLRDGDEALLVKCWGGCAAEDVLAELRARRLLDDQAPIPRASRTPAKPAPNDSGARLRGQHEKAAWLWSQRQPMIGTIAERYLRGRRKITCPPPPTLAFLPPRKPERHPAMLAAFALPDETEPGRLGAPRNVEAVHLTLLHPDGSNKANVEPNKIIVGSPGNLPIVLAPPNDLLGMAICEGIEDALTAHQATGLGAWAAGSAGHMRSLAETIPDSNIFRIPTLNYVEAVTIYAHADRAGRKGALKLAERLDQRGIEVRIEGLP